MPIRRYQPGIFEAPNESTQPAPSNMRRRLLAAGAVLATSSALLACSSDGADEPKSACDDRVLLIETGDNLANAARKCIEHRTGGIAVVGFGGISEESIQMAAVDAYMTLNVATDGLLRPNIVPMKASQSAERQYNLVNSSCYHSEDYERLAGRIADKAMNLGGYKYVVGIVDQSKCEDGGGGGLAHTSDGQSRYLSIIDTKSMQERKKRDGQYPGDDMSDFIAHELGHSYGLGHTSWLNSEELNGMRFSRGNFYLKPVDGVIDLTSAVTDIKDEEFDEYGGDNNLMGQHANNYDLLGVQERQLEWPERVLGEKKDIQYDITGSTATISRYSENERNYFSLRLDNPVVYVREGDDSEQTFQYDQLIIEPAGGNAKMVKVYAASDHYSSQLNIGFISFFNNIYGNHEPVSLKINNQKINISEENGSYTVSDASVSNLAKG